MKYMGWSWADYLEAPKELVDDIIDMINQEAAEAERIRNEALG